MNKMSKIALISASVLSVGALTACQSTTSPSDKHHSRMMKDHHGKHDRKMSAEQREQFAKSRAERKEVMKQIQQACDNKASGSTVQIKVGDKTIDGTCNMVFTPEHKGGKNSRGEHRPMRGDARGHVDFKRGEPLTDAKRAELTKQYEQRLAERQAREQAIATACQGKKDNTKVQIKAGTQTVDGKCEVRFLPKPPTASTPAVPTKS